MKEAGGLPEVLDHITKANEERCKIFMDNYDNMFKSGESERQITKTRDIFMMYEGVTLAAQCLPARHSHMSADDLKLSRDEPKVNMQHGPLKKMLKFLSAFGTGALAYWKTPVWTIVWRFMDGKFVWDRSGQTSVDRLQTQPRIKSLNFEILTQMSTARYGVRMSKQ